MGGETTGVDQSVKRISDAGARKMDSTQISRASIIRRHVLRLGEFIQSPDIARNPWRNWLWSELSSLATAAYQSHAAIAAHLQDGLASDCFETRNSAEPQVPDKNALTPE
jgi:hypothetical protein